jgi:hypothetical protein
MLEHPYTSRCILIAAMALLGAASAHAASKGGPVADASGKDASPAIALAQLGGTWKNVKSGVNVRIEQGAAGWEVWFSTTGEARITLPEKNRPAIKIDGRNFTCSYSVTLPSSETMKWDLTQGQPETQCLTGVFTRLGPPPSAVKQVAPAREVKHEPPAVERPAEVQKPPQPEPATEPAPVSGGEARLMTPPRPMSRHAGIYRHIRHRGWRYAASGHWPYRYFRYRYRWYVIYYPRCDCR